MKDYSIVVPIYNDAYLAEALCQRVEAVFTNMLNKERLEEQDLELLFVNDGSADNSLQVLRELVAIFPFVKVVDLSRNFGQHAAISCGFNLAAGEVVLRMNVDMQDLPDDIPLLLEEMQQASADLVVGQYSDRKSPLQDKVSAYVYYGIFNFLTGIEVPQNTSSLRAMSRKYIEAHNELKETVRFPQGIDHWLGFKHRYVPIEHHERIDKKSSYNFASRMRLAFDGILYFSDRPIRLVAGAGFLMSVMGFLIAFWMIIEKVLGTNFLPGFVSLLSAALIAFGINVGILGLIGLYVGKIFQEVKGRPQFIIRDIFEVNNGKA